VARILVVSAFEPEIAPLRRLIGGARDVETATVGVGAIDAAVGAARAIAATQARQLIFVGTAGAYWRGRLTAAVGSAAVASALACVSTAALRGDGYLPDLVVIDCETSARLRASLGGCARPAAPPRLVACPLAITRSAALGRRIADATGASLENLEAFAVGRAATAAGVEFAAVLGVANRVGPAGHSQWLAHHRAASRAACGLIARYLTGAGAPLGDC
jgi:nucleoside phosphorylase